MWDRRRNQLANRRFEKPAMEREEGHGDARTHWNALTTPFPAARFANERTFKYTMAGGPPRLERRCVRRQSSRSILTCRLSCQKKCVGGCIDDEHIDRARDGVVGPFLGPTAGYSDVADGEAPQRAHAGKPFGDMHRPAAASWE